MKAAIDEPTESPTQSPITEFPRFSCSSEAFVDEGDLTGVLTDYVQVVTPNCDQDARRLRDRAKDGVDSAVGFLCADPEDDTLDTTINVTGTLFSNDCANAAALLTRVLGHEFRCASDGRFVTSRYSCEAAMPRLNNFAKDATAVPSGSPTTSPTSSATSSITEITSQFTTTSPTSSAT